MWVSRRPRGGWIRNWSCFDAKSLTFVRFLPAVEVEEVDFTRIFIVMTNNGIPTRFSGLSAIAFRIGMDGWFESICEPGFR